jgi:GAF domain-containing protein
VAITDNEPDGIANMANVAALLAEFLPDLNWAGFYRMVEGELVLGPFIGKPACIRIPLDRGVCGAAARPEPRSGWRTSTPFPAISPAMRPAGPNWSCP